VALKIRSEDLFPDNWIYIHDSKVKVGRIQNFRSWSPEMVPDESVACVGLEYFCFEGDDLWAASDDDLVALATREMQSGPGAPDQVIGGVVVRQEKAYPVYDDAYAANVAAMRAELEAPPTLHWWAQRHAPLQQPGPRDDDRDAHGGKHRGQARVYDIWCVNEDAEYHEAGAEGAAAGLPETRAPHIAPPWPPRADQAAALASLRAVPHRSSRPRPPDRRPPLWPVMARI
jgi:hypothetical protein